MNAREFLNMLHVAEILGDTLDKIAREGGKVD